MGEGGRGGGEEGRRGGGEGLRKNGEMYMYMYMDIVHYKPQKEKESREERNITRYNLHVLYNTLQN